MMPRRRPFSRTGADSRPHGRWRPAPRSQSPRTHLMETLDRLHGVGCACCVPAKWARVRFTSARIVRVHQPSMRKRAEFVHWQSGCREDGRMARAPDRKGDNGRDDADARGEHVYGARRPGRTIQPVLQQREENPVDYVAGADGTHHVRTPPEAAVQGTQHDPTRPEPRPEPRPPSPAPPHPVPIPPSPEPQPPVPTAKRPHDPPIEPTT
jgi:hypothetical protein